MKRIILLTLTALLLTQTASAECIELPDLMGYITEWKQGNTGMVELMEKIGAWKAGTGCEECTEASDCDDGFSCTIDDCIQGECTNTPDNSKCNTGETCDPTNPQANPTTGCVEEGEEIESLTRFEITWTFDKPLSLDGHDGTYQYGQYINGDYWVRNPNGSEVKITLIDPPTMVVDSPKQNGETFYDRVINCGTINPIPSNLQGNDSAASQWVDDFCLTRNISAQTPLTISVSEHPIKSLVSTISTEVVATKTSTPRIQDASILTIVANAPPQNAFRPPYAGNYKPAEILESDIQWDALQNLPLPEHTPPLSESERNFERVWLCHKGPYPGSVINPVNNMPDYGQQEGMEKGIAALQLNLDYSQAQKEPLLIHYLQNGIDIYGIADCQESLVGMYGNDYAPNRIWYGAGGIGIGKRTSLIFAAKVLNHEGMIETLQKQGDYLYEQTDEDGYPDPYGPGEFASDFSNFPPDYIQFGEEQVTYITQNHIDAMTDGRWAPDDRVYENVQYTQVELGLPEWGQRVAENVGDCDKSLLASYRNINGGQQVGSALALHMMGAEEITNHRPWFDYYDRYVSIIEVFTHPKAWRFGVSGLDLYASEPFVWETWNAYREDYGCVWKRDTQACSEYSDCGGITGVSWPDSICPRGEDVKYYNVCIDAGEAQNADALWEISICNPDSTCYSQGYYYCPGDNGEPDQSLTCASGVGGNTCTGGKCQPEDLDVDECSDYKNQRALDYDPCQLGCN